MTSGNLASTRRAAAEDSHRRNLVRREHPRGYPRPGLLTSAQGNDDSGSDLALTASFQKIGNASIDIQTPGRYLVFGYTHLDVSTSGYGQALLTLYQDGSQVDTGGEEAAVADIDADDPMLVYAWEVLVDGSTLPSTVELRAKKTSGGTVTAKAARTRILVTSNLGGGAPGAPGGGSSTWVGLTDTPGSIDALRFVRGASGGSALEMLTAAQVMAALSGQAAAAFSMNGYKMMGLAAAVASGDAVRYDEFNGHGSGVHSGKIGEVPFILPIPLAQPLASGTGQAAVDYEHRDWGNGETRINRIYARARSNVSGDVTLKLYRNGSPTHASDTVTISSGTRESSVTTLNSEITLANGDDLDVEQTTSVTDDIPVDFYVLGDQDVVAAL